jgi:hypothetical protein
MHRIRVLRLKKDFCEKTMRQAFARRAVSRRKVNYFFKCPETSLVISNMLTCFLPLKTA